MVDELVENIPNITHIELIKYMEKQTCRVFKKTSNYPLDDCKMKSQNRLLINDLDGLHIHNIEETIVLLEENDGQYEFGDIGSSVTRISSTQDIPLHKPEKNALRSSCLNVDNKCELYVWYIIYFGTVIGAFWFAIFYVWVPMIKALIAQNL